MIEVDGKNNRVIILGQSLKSLIESMPPPTHIRRQLFSVYIYSKEYLKKEYLKLSPSYSIIKQSLLPTSYDLFCLQIFKRSIKYDLILIYQQKIITKQIQNNSNSWTLIKKYAKGYISTFIHQYKVQRFCSDIYHRIEWHKLWY